MDPITMAIMGVAGPALSGALGAYAQNQAAQYNYAANMANIEAQNQARQQAIRLAQQQDRDNKLGTTDASGNRTYFVDGVGWVTDLSEQGARINQAQQNEQEAVLNTDLPRKRRIEGENERGQNVDRATADTLQRTFMDRFRSNETPADMEAYFRDAGTRGVNEATDATTTAAMRSAVRGGASNTGDILAKLDQGRAKSLSDVFMDARAKGQDYFDKDRAADLGSASQLYNLFASRAAGTNNVNYQPGDFSGKGATTTLQQGDMANNKTEMDAMTQPVGTVDYIQPNMGVANALGQTGNAIMGAGSYMGARQDMTAMRDMWSRMLMGSPYGNRLQYGG